MTRPDHGLSTADIEALADFLASPDRPAGTLSFHELQGFLFAVASSPEIVMPSDWMPLISDDEEMGYANLKEANAMLGRITALYNQVNTHVLERSDKLPAGCAFREDVLANLDEDAPISQWSRGFAIGHDWLSEVWDAFLPESLDEQYTILVVTLSFFGSRRLAESYVTEMFSKAAVTKRAMQSIATTMRGGFPAALSSYADLGRTLSDLNA